MFVLRASFFGSLPLLIRLAPRPLFGLARLATLLHFRCLLNHPSHDPEYILAIEKMRASCVELTDASFFRQPTLMTDIKMQYEDIMDLKARLNSQYRIVFPLKDALEPSKAADYAEAFNEYKNLYEFHCDIVATGENFENAASFCNENAHEPFSPEELQSAFDIFFALSQEQLDTEITFLDPVVAEIYKNPDTDLSAKADEKSIQSWKAVRECLMSVPFAQVPIHPLDRRATLYPREAELLLAVATETFSNSAPPAEKLRKKLGAESLTRQILSGKGDSFQATKKSEEPGKSSADGSEKIKVYNFDLNTQQLRFFFMGVVGGLLLFFVYTSQESKNEISFQEFTADFLRKNLVNRIRVINNRTAVVELNDIGQNTHANQKDYYFTIGSMESFERSLRAVQDEYNVPDLLRVPVVYTTEGSMAKLLVNFLPTFLFLGAIYYMTKKVSLGGMGGPLGFGKSTAKKFNQEKDIKIKFKDVAGMNEAKEEVMEFVKFLQNPGKYEKLGAKIPRGAILSGPPGTGKTLIAKATAGEAGVPFYSVSGSEFVEMFVGVGASRVRDLFKTARENAPSIVFVDEIDAIGKQRSKGNASGSNDERETTLNQLLVEMDGFETSDHVVVLAGTNRADILDKALMRPGRFDRHIAIDNPELQGRKEIFEVHLKKIKLVQDIDKDLPGRLAALTPGFSGADIANVCNEAALIAARYNAKAVTLRHFELAIERVIGGVEKKSKLLSPEEKKIVAYHEAGHAVCGWFLKHAHPLLKVSIIPRGQGALGYAQYLPPDQYLMSAAQLYDRMIMTLGGRVSEELNFASVTSGAYDDFKKVTNIAQSMVIRFGMSPKVGMVNYADTQGQDNLTKPFSDETNNIIDGEIQRIVQDCHDKCKQLLTEKAEQVELVAQELLKKEFITREDMIRLLGKRPFAETNDAFDKYLDGKDAFKNEQPKDEKKDSD